MNSDCLFRAGMLMTMLVSIAVMLLVGTGCSAMVPLGREARLGYVALECRYLPPIGGVEGRGSRVEGWQEGGRE